MPASNLSPALNSIFDTIHRHMKSPRSRVTPAAPAIPAPILDITRYKTVKNSNNNTSDSKPATPPSQAKSPNLQALAKKAVPVPKMHTKNTKTKKTATKPPKLVTANKQVKQINKQVYDKNKSLPQLKATLQQKTQQNMRRIVFNENGQYNFQAQRRMREIIRQRDILDNILKEHSKLKRDRETLAHEMQMMKNYLDDIKGRLDDSVQKLNSSPTVYERVMRPRRILLTKKQQDSYISKPGLTQRPIKLHSRLIN